MTLTEFVVGMLFGIVPLYLGMRMKAHPEMLEEMGAVGTSGDWSESRATLLAWVLIVIGLFDLCLFCVDLSA